MNAVTHGQTQAEQWLDAYTRDWDGDIDRMFSEAAFP